MREGQLSFIVLFGSADGLVKVLLTNFLLFIKYLGFIQDNIENTVVTRELTVEQDQR